MTDHLVTVENRDLSARSKNSAPPAHDWMRYLPQRFTDTSFDSIEGK
jgi:hypothetical protein